MDDSLFHQSSRVFVVDADPALCAALRRVADGENVEIDRYSTTDDFFAACSHDHQGCIFVDLDLPQLTGPALFEDLARRHIFLPVVVVSARGDAAAAVDAMKAGAVDYLQKPSDDESLFHALRGALRWDQCYRREVLLGGKVRRKLEKLTAGELELLDLLVEGWSNRDAATHLDRSVRAVEVRRAKLMKNLGAKSLADLVRMVITARHFGFGVPGNGFPRAPR